MRVSSSMIYQNNQAALQQTQSALIKTQQQIATGKNFANPSDDPIAANTALEVSNRLAAHQQFQGNRSSARHTVSMTENVMGNMMSTLQDARQTIVNGLSSGTLSASDRQTFATQLNQLHDQLLSSANSQDGVGNYLFSGFASQTMPFTKAAAGVVYSGNSGEKAIQVEATLQMGISVPGDKLLMGVKDGNGIFAVQGAATNTGSGVAHVATIGNPAYTGDQYKIVVSSSATSPSGLAYDVLNVTQATTVASAVPFVQGQSITQGGFDVTLDGMPNNGDSFIVKPSQPQSIFQTLTTLSNALSSGATLGTYTEALSSGLTQLDRVMGNVMTHQGIMGIKLNSLDQLDSFGGITEASLQQLRADVQDVDYAKAMSQLAQEQMYLQAAQKSFATTSGLSLFNYI